MDKLRSIFTAAAALTGLITIASFGPNLFENDNTNWLTAQINDFLYSKLDLLTEIPDISAIGMVLTPILALGFLGIKIGDMIYNHAREDYKFDPQKAMRAGLGLLAMAIAFPLTGWLQLQTGFSSPVPEEVFTAAGLIAYTAAGHFLIRPTDRPKPLPVYDPYQQQAAYYPQAYGPYPQPYY